MKPLGVVRSAGSAVRMGMLMVAIAMSITSCGAGRGAATADKKEEAAVVLGPSDVAVVAAADLAEGVPVSGNLQPVKDVNLTAPAPDVVAEVLVKEGQAVRRGQVLARFRTQALGPAVASAEAQQRIAAADHERMKNLAAAGAVSQRDVENAEAAQRAADATLAQVRQRFEDATVRAPFDGVVAERHVQAGDRVGDGDPMFRVVDTSALEFEATVTAENAARLRVGTPVALAVTGVDVGITGRIARINTTADAATRQVRVYVAVPNRDHRLVGDLFASGRVVLHQARAALGVPASAVRTAGGDSAIVWVIAADKLERRPVVTGVRDESLDRIEIRQGLRAGEKVVAVVIEGLEPGQSVQVAGQGVHLPPGPETGAPQPGARRK